MTSRAGEELTTQLDLGGTLGGRAEDARAYLVIHRGEEAAVQVVEVGEELVVGRASDADVVVDDGRASRRNTTIMLRDDGLFARDLGGRNGTKIGGEVVRGEERRLQRGQQVVVGPVRIVVSSLPRARSVTSDDLVVVDPKMKEVVAVTRRLAEVPTTVLLHGETGVGKEVMAELIHHQSSRRTGPFVRLNCAAVPASLIESELFGHERGAFTGAVAQKRGYLEAANGGTLLLDEIGDLPLDMQVKLLRVLETRRVQRIGAREDVAIDIRILCATHRDLERMVAAGEFRQDLFYRIAGFVLEVPPLRERPLDIPPLVARFLDRFAAQTGMAEPEVSDAAMRRLATHGWPGNVRELRNAVEHAAVLAGTRIEVEHLPRGLREPNASVATSGGTMRDAVDEAERRAIEEALAAAEGHRGRAAELLGVSKRTLQYKLAKYGFHE